MSTPEVKVKATLEDDDFRTSVTDLATFIQTEVGKGFANAVSQGNVVSQFTAVIKDLTNAANQLAGTLKSSAGAIKDFTQKAENSKEKVENLSKSMARLFANALKGSNSSQKFAQAILKQAVAAGAGADTITALATATGVFSAKQIELATTVSRLQQEIKTLSKDADTNEDSFKSLVRSSNQLISAQQKLEQEFKNTVRALKDTAQAEKVLLEIEKRVEAVRAKKFATLLKATTAEQKFTQAILKQVSATGAAAPLLQRLASASGAFSAEEIRAASAVAKLTAEVEKQARTFNGTVAAESKLINKSKELVSAQKKLAAVQAKATKAQKKFNNEIKGADRFFGPFQSGVAKLNNVMAGFRNIIDIVDSTLVQLFRTAKEGAVIDQTSLSFENLATNITGIPDLLSQLDSAAQGTISTFKLQAETLTLVAGLGPELSRTFSQALSGTGEYETSLIDIARAAQLLNPSLGDVDFFLQSLSIGIKRNERRWIDNLGIVISAREAYQRFAEANGKSVLEMSATDKTLATLNETMRVGSLLIDQTADGAESLVDPFSRLETKVKNLTDSWKVLIKDALIPWAKLAAGDETTAIETSLDGIVSGANDATAALIEAGQTAVNLRLKDLDLSPSQRIVAEKLFEGQRIKRLRDIVQGLASEASTEEELVINLGLAFEGSDLNELERALRLEVRRLKGLLGEETLIEEGITFSPLGAANVDSIDDVASAIFRVVAGQEQAIAAAVAVSNATQIEIDNFKKLKVAIDDVALKFREQQLDITKDFFISGLEDAKKQEFGKALAQSFRDQFAEGLREGGQSETLITSVRVLFGELDEGAVDALESTLQLNEAVADLTNLLTKRNVTDPQVIASAFLALELGFAGSASEALSLARNVEFVTNVLLPAQEAAKGTAEGMGELSDETKAANEAVKELRDSLRSISDQGFERAAGIIERIREAQKGIAESEGEQRTVQINNSRRIVEIEEELFGDLPEEQREDLNKRLDEIRKDGDDFSDEYALILQEIGTDLSQSQRDALLLERFELQGRQGEFITAVFGLDKKALEGFQEDEREAISELIENRRQTIFELLTEGREAGFETEIQLSLSLGLIDDFEAELLIKERQIFDLIDGIFGEGAVFQLGEKIIDFGEISVNELDPSQIAGIVESFEQAVSDGFSEEAGQVLDILISLVITGEVEIDDFPTLLDDALSQLGEDVGGDAVTATEAVSVTLLPTIDSAENVRSLKRMATDFEKWGETLQPTIQEQVDQIKTVEDAVKNVEKATQRLNDEDEIEVEVIANTEDAIEAVQSFLDSIPDEVTIDINTNIDEDDFRTPRSREQQGTDPTSSGDSGGDVREGVFRHGGFTGHGNPNATAGRVEFEEFVFDQGDVQNLGVNSLQALRDGASSIVPNTALFAQDTVSAMLDAISNPTPTLMPAAVSSTNTTNRTMSVDQSTNITNNFFDRASAEVAPVLDVF